jgi:hypothetical protein
MLNEQPLHNVGGQADKCLMLLFAVGIGGPQSAYFYQAKIKFVDQGGRFPGVARTLVTHTFPRKTAQFGIKEVNKLPRSHGIATAEIGHQPSHRFWTRLPVNHSDYLPEYLIWIWRISVLKKNQSQMIEKGRLLALMG